jgi:hypothetical protein
MTTGYSTLTPKEVVREVKAMRQTTKKITATRKRAVAFLISAGIVAKNGKRLASKYR